MLNETYNQIKYLHIELILALVISIMYSLDT